MDQLLYIVRHGVAVEHGTPGYDDDDRPLTPDGERRLRGVARGLKALGVGVDRVVTSPLPRARRTAEIVADALDLRDGPEDADALRAGRGAESLRDWLGTRHERRLMVVGHNPALSGLVGLLLAGRLDPPLCELRKGGVAGLVGLAGGGYRLDWLARPRLLRGLGRSR